MKDPILVMCRPASGRVSVHQNLVQVIAASQRFFLEIQLSEVWVVNQTHIVQPLILKVRLFESFVSEAVLVER